MCFVEKTEQGAKVLVSLAGTCFLEGEPENADGLVASPPSKDTQISFLPSVLSETRPQRLVVLVFLWLLDVLCGSPFDRDVSRWFPQRIESPNLLGIAEPKAHAAVTAFHNGRRAWHKSWVDL
jgi:hypothetical protein